MMTTGGAAIVAMASILFACLLGIASGGVIGLISRRRWTIKTVVFDLLTGATVACAFAFVTVRIAEAQGAWDTPLWPMFASAPASVLIRHLLLPARRSRAGSAR